VRELHGQMNSTSATYFGGLGFNYRPRIRLSTMREFGVLSVLSTLYRDNISDSGTMVFLPIFSNSLLIIQTPDAAEDLSPDILSESLHASVVSEMCECGIH